MFDSIHSSGRRHCSPLLDKDVPAQHRIDVFIPPKLHPVLFLRATFLQRVWLRDDSHRAFAFLIDTTSIHQNTLLACLVLSRDDSQDDLTLLFDLGPDQLTAARDIFVSSARHSCLQQASEIYEREWGAPGTLHIGSQACRRGPSPCRSGRPSAWSDLHMPAANRRVSS